MSMDELPPPRAEEVAEVTIEVEGAIDAATFRKLKEALKECIEKLRAQRGGRGVRWVRAAIRRRP